MSDRWLAFTSMPWAPIRTGDQIIIDDKHKLSHSIDDIS